MTYATTDWDWFFSSVAQSAAAIVAIFAGFIINKILANQARHQAAVDQMAWLRTEAIRLRAEATSLPFESYSSGTNDAALWRAARLLAAGPDSTGMDWTVEALLANERMSIFCPEASNRRKMTELYDRFQASTDEEKNRLRRTTVAIPLNNPYRHLGLASPLSGIANGWKVDDSPQEKRRSERERIDVVQRSVLHHIRLIRDFNATVKRADVNRQSIGRWLRLVVALFFLGVIYPLSFLPTAAPPRLTYDPIAVLSAVFTHRGLLLTGISAAFLWVVWIFARINNQTTHTAEEQDRLDHFLSTNAYAAELGHAEASGLKQHLE